MRFKIKFKIKLWIKDKSSQEIIELNKIDDIEVQWEGGRGRGKKRVNFEKGGKVYQILVKILLEGYLLGMRNIVGEWKFFVPPLFLTKFIGEYMGEPNNSPAKDRERQETVELTNEWRWVA